MSKSHDVSDFLRMHSLVLKEIGDRLPDIRSELEKDYVRLRLICPSRGESVFLLDLPAIGKGFLEALSEGRLSRMALPLSRCDHGSVIPRLYKGLWKKVFSDDGILRNDIDPYVIKAMEMLFFMFKKFEREAPPAALFEATKEFVDVDSALLPPSHDWLGAPDFHRAVYSVRDRLEVATGPLYQSVSCSDNSADSRLLDTIQRVADVVSTSIGLLNPGPGRHGPGAVAENKFGVVKYGVDHWQSRMWRKFNPLGLFRPVRDCSTFCEDERASVLLAVPKTMKGPRLIAKEPASNLFVQFMVAEELEKWIDSGPLRNSISLRDQSKSSSLALRSSADRSYGTIDLKSASDRLSLWLVERLFRRNRDLLETFHAVRTAFCDVSIDKKLTSLVKLRKFATQGTALTFPVQSIVFTIICIGTLAYARGVRKIDSRVIERIGKEVRVYGDDILVPTDQVELVCKALELLLLKVNRAKTHYKGLFREACGVDAYAGVEVTPTYVSLLPTMRPCSVNRLVEMSNNAYLSGWRRLAEYIRRSVPDYRQIPIVPDTGSGFVAFVRDGFILPEQTKVRWNPSLQRAEALLLKVTSKSRRQKVGASLLLSSYLAETQRREVLLPTPGLDPWRPLSRIEVLASEAKKWVSLPQYDGEVMVG